MVPITLVSGCLGSGKSTLLNHIIHTFPDKRIGVVVNEFGEVALESAIIEPLSDAVIQLRSGCMCCAARDDVVAAIDSLREAAPDLEHILVEASGDSDPVPVIQTLAAATFNNQAALSSVICIVDLVQYPVLRDTNPLLRRGLAGADVVLLSKADLVLPHTVEQDIRAYLPSTPVLVWDNELNLNILLEHSHSDASRLESLLEAVKHTQQSAVGGAHHSLCATFYRSTVPLDRDLLDAFFASLPAEVVRAKGFFSPAGPEGPYVKYIVQYTSGRYERYPRPWSTVEPHETALLLLHNNAEEQELRRRITRCHPQERGTCAHETRAQQALD